MKYRVLIVDDEFRIGKLIRKLIQWDDLNMECIDTADNGEKAYQIICEQPVDIVITDIRMPKINGLDLIRMAKEKNTDIKFVVMSGYKEFEYAHQAMKYGVEEYLLKPVNEEELNKVMKKIRDVLDEKKETLQKKENLEAVVKKSRQIIRKNFLNNIIDQEEQKEIQEEQKLLDGELYRGIDIKLDYISYDQADKKQDLLLVEKVTAVVEKNLKDDTKDVLICDKENLHIYCLFDYDAAKSRKIRDGINNILSEIQELVAGLEQYDVTIGIGNEKREFRDIRFSIREANRAVLNRIKKGVGRLIYFENLSLNREFQNPFIQYKDYIKNSIGDYSKSEMEQYINLIYSPFLMNEDLEYSVCYDMAYEFVEIFFDSIEMNWPEPQSIAGKIQSKIQHCNTIIELKNTLKTEMGNCLDMAMEAMETESTRPIRLARKYIEEHFNEKIMLEDIAEIIGLNPVYFSVVFKKETGMNFSSYLTGIRMEKAKEMLCNTNETISAIADQVGYKDARYFSQIFTKTIGIKPRLYRRLYS